MGMAGTILQGWRRTSVGGALAVLAVAGALLAGATARAAAGPCGQGYCVVMIEVNGLTPQDVTPQSTPFMWALAHPDEPNSGAQVPNQVLTPQGSNVQRAGWIWQAPRGVMSASNAAATASLLTGLHPENSGVPANEFHDSSGWKAIWGDANASTSSAEHPAPVTSSKGTTILSLVQQSASSGQSLAKAYVGDPALFKLATDNADDCQKGASDSSAVAGWRPGSPQETMTCPNVTLGQGDPALCPPPPADNPSAASTTACPADDAQTMSAATNDLTAPGGSNLQLSYIYLAELGIVKQRSGNVQAALSDTDQAIANYVTSYAQQSATSAKWNNTVLMIVGNHGYESTPQVLRVPNPQDQTQTTSLVDYIKSIGAGSVEVVPQGSTALVYYTGNASDPAKRDSVLKSIRQQVLALNGNPNMPQCSPPQAPASDPSGTAPGQCVDDVVYTSPNALDGGDANTVAAKHPTWHLGTGPAEMVLMGRGWAAAPLAPSVSPSSPSPDTSSPTNPYPATDGGPRNRAVAALIDGPRTLVRQINGPNPDGSWDGRDPVTNGPATGDPNSQTPQFQSAPASASGSSTTAAPAVNQANANPGDDANAKGHEQQPATVDFMPTIAALMQISTTGNQLDGSIIEVPWTHLLSAVSDFQDIGVALPPPEPPPLPPPEIVPPPPPPPSYDFHGLLRRLRARVGTVAHGHFVPARKTRPGTRLEYIDLSADFGKPLTAVTLTLYRPGTKAAGGAAGSGRRQLVTLARFLPFTVPRGPGVELRFRVPAQLAPTAIGVLVQEAFVSQPRPHKPGGKPEPNFHGAGPTGGGIVTLEDAGLLHKRSPARHRGHRRHR
jgi:hypothetical protein